MELSTVGIYVLIVWKILQMDFSFPCFLFRFRLILSYSALDCPKISRLLVYWSRLELSIRRLEYRPFYKSTNQQIKQNIQLKCYWYTQKTYGENFWFYDRRFFNMPRTSICSTILISRNHRFGYIWVWV